MTCLGVLERGERSDDNGTSLKEGGLVEMSTTVLAFAMLALSLWILTVVVVFIFVSLLFCILVEESILNSKNKVLLRYR